ncbi:helix-turn-helix domain-containing protein [Paraburkholderia sp. Tr-20389]|uniref:citrate synthase family protein n=1 Tax=Paraburkholderia sp. Tr-20389 TaxID=2703903 RepID=UPI001981FC1E|nr:citrate synthase family protein [Paraburkholderia sp. Tr-20389]MBN3752196.1 helix-turn-helix domain-containing protein [Paraburkholderia sp. Tr-20389]
MTQEEACEALGVRKQTLYAYVSRGQIEVRWDPDHTSRKLYRSSDISALMKKRDLGRARKNIAASTMAWGEPIINTHISTIVRGRLYYRGKDAIHLAATATLEEAAQLLWDSLEPPCFPAFEALEIDGPARARVFAAMSMAAARSCSGSARDVAGMHAEAAELVGRLASGFVELPADEGPLHLRIAGAWRAGKHADLLRQTLVLLADQELTSSSFAARVAASTGASLGACVLAGLAAFSGPLHGDAIARVYRLLDDAHRAGIEQTVRSRLAESASLPGFGHELYPQGDPRAAYLLSMLTPSETTGELIRCVDRLTGKQPTIDVALAALVEHCQLQRDAAFALFAVARSVGWAAHSIEQMMGGTLLRPRAHYVGPAVDEGEGVEG